VAPNRLRSASCFWGNPDFEGPRLGFKRDLQREYKGNKTMTTLCKSVLGLTGPSWDDLVRGLNELKGRDVIPKHIEDIYGYMFHAFKKDKENWINMK
jgi:hypothetical protein